MKRKFAALVVLLIALMQFSVAAEARSLPDINKICSLTIDMAYRNNPLPDALLTIYHVGEVRIENALAWYDLTSEFSGVTGVEFDEMTSSENRQFASTLKAYVNANNITGTSGRTNSRGRVTFSDLEAGIYLLVPGPYSGYYTIEPSLMVIPQQDGDNGWIYDVTASPKSEPEPTPTSTYPPTTRPPTTRPPSTTRPPTTTRPPSDPPSYTPTPYTPPVSEYVIDPEETPMGVEEIYEFEPEIPMGDLPQTGVLRWPIPVLAIAGVFLFGFGWAMNNREKKNDEI